jgi:Spy/CpxP family protein refolding chaperone
MRRWGGRGRRGEGARGFGRVGGGFEEAGLLNNPAIRQRLGITADQTAKIRQQDSDFQKSEIQARAALEVKQIEMRDLLAAANPDRAAIDAKVQDVGAAQTALEKAAVDHGLAVRDILTAAQRQQLQQLRTDGFQAGGAPGAPRGGNQANRGNQPRGQRGGAAPPAPNQQRQAPPNQ